jgi:hypothetical protein
MKEALFRLLLGPGESLFRCWASPGVRKQVKTHQRPFLSHPGPSWVGRRVAIQ